jgi:hypothetical protein
VREPDGFLSFKDSAVNESEVQRRLVMLEGKVHALNLAMHDVANDGNCFYRALAVVMTGTQDAHHSIRQSIADYVESRGNILGGIINASASEFRDYITALRTPNNYDYVGEETGAAAAAIYGREVHIHSALLPPRVFLPTSAATQPPLNLAFCEPAHYMALLPDGASSGCSKLNL